MSIDTEAPYVTRLEVAYFGCIEQVDLKLTRLHAFVGPNDSGKSTILRAATQVLQPNHQPRPDYELRGAFPRNHPSIRAFWSGGTLMSVSRNGSGVSQPDDRNPRLTTELARLTRTPQITQNVRLDPDTMRGNQRPIPSHNRVVLGIRGDGLASVLSALLEQEREVFDSIETRLSSLFPHLRRIRILTTDQGTKSLGFRFDGGNDVDAYSVSEGILYALAFITLTTWKRALVLLVEEPENGLHPARIAEVVKMLRAVSHETQVLMATHSPLVLNELSGEEISIVTRPAGGSTQVTRLCDTPNYTERSKVYQNGELWLSYGDATEERALLHGEPCP